MPPETPSSRKAAIRLPTARRVGGVACVLGRWKAKESERGNKIGKTSTPFSVSHWVSLVLLYVQRIAGQLPLPSGNSGSAELVPSFILQLPSVQSHLLPFLQSAIRAAGMIMTGRTAKY